MFANQPPIKNSVFAKHQNFGGESSVITRFFVPVSRKSVCSCLSKNDNTKTLLANGVGTYGKTKKKVYLSEYHSYYISVKSESNWTVDFGTGEAVTTLN